MGLMNRLMVAKNVHQGKQKRVLCVCSGGVLRSPTAAWVLSNPPFNYNTRAAGVVSDYALVPVDQVLLAWADHVVVMTPEHHAMLNDTFPEHGKPVTVLGIEDNYGYRDPDLIKMIAERYSASVGFEL